MSLTSPRTRRLLLPKLPLLPARQCVYDVVKKGRRAGRSGQDALPLHQCLFDWVKERRSQVYVPAPSPGKPCLFHCRLCHTTVNGERPSIIWFLLQH